MLFNYLTALLPTLKSKRLWCVVLKLLFCISCLGSLVVRRQSVPRFWGSLQCTQQLAWRDSWHSTGTIEQYDWIWNYFCPLFTCSLGQRHLCGQIEGLSWSGVQGHRIAEEAERARLLQECSWRQQHSPCARNGINAWSVQFSSLTSRWNLSKASLKFLLRVVEWRLSIRQWSSINSSMTDSNAISNMLIFRKKGNNKIKVNLSENLLLGVDRLAEFKPLIESLDMSMLSDCEWLIVRLCSGKYM